MVNRFGSAKKPHAPLPKGLLPHQERVNIEMFRAIEALGRKLERVEGERDRLARRLALIESAATVDEKTGKLYLPVSVDSAVPAEIGGANAPRWMVAASLMSSALALCALAIVLFRPVPQHQVLTREQLAALDAIAQPRSMQFDGNAWKRLKEDEAQAFLAKAAPPSDEPPPLPAMEETEAAQIAALEPPQAPEEVEPAAGWTQDAAEAEGMAAFTVEEELKAEDVAAAATAPEPVEEAAKAEPAPAPAPAQSPEPAATEEEVARTEPQPQPAPAQKAEDSSGDVGRDAALSGEMAGLEARAFEGVPEAQHDLATLYASGKAAAQDYKRAAYWFSKAADGGIANAHYNLGVMFQQGLGVRQDVTKALGWYHRAADLGHPEAMYNLGIAYIEGVGAEQSVERGVSWFKRAANAGVSQAAYNLGVLYESNFIGPIDTDKAVEWYSVAANEGHDEAMQAITRLRGPGAGEDDRGAKVADIEPAAGEELSGEGDASSPDDEDSATPYDSLVARVQAVLMARGMLPDGTPSGRMDARTSDAIRAFQAKTGLSVDGRASQQLLDRLLVEKK